MTCVKLNKELNGIEIDRHGSHQHIFLCRAFFQLHEDNREVSVPAFLLSSIFSFLRNERLRHEILPHRHRLRSPDAEARLHLRRPPVPPRVASEAGGGPGEDCRDWPHQPVHVSGPFVVCIEIVLTHQCRGCRKQKIRQLATADFCWPNFQRR